MSDFEDEKPHSSNIKNHKFKRISVEIEVTELVKSGKLQTKSDELKRQERFSADYEKELDNIDSKKEFAENELEKYNNLKSNMDMYFADELQLDLTIDSHRELSAFLKKHVSLLTDYENNVVKSYQHYMFH